MTEFSREMKRNSLFVTASPEKKFQQQRITIKVMIAKAFIKALIKMIIYKINKSGKSP